MAGEIKLTITKLKGGSIVVGEAQENQEAETPTPREVVEKKEEKPTKKKKATSKKSSTTKKTRKAKVA